MPSSYDNTVSRFVFVLELECAVVDFMRSLMSDILISVAAMGIQQIKQRIGTGMKRSSQEILAVGVICALSLFFIPLTVHAKEKQMAPVPDYIVAWEARKSLMNARPDELSDEQIAQELAEGATGEIGKFPGIMKWGKPLRVSVRDGNGIDLDLSQYPGIKIREYLTNLSSSVNVPLSITTRGNNDGNVSIVVEIVRLPKDNYAPAWLDDLGLWDEFKKNEASVYAIDESNPHAGDLKNIPDRLYKADASGNKYLDRDTDHWGEGNIYSIEKRNPDLDSSQTVFVSSHWEYYHSGHNIKGCKILITSPSLPMTSTDKLIPSWIDTPVILDYTLSLSMLNCLGMREPLKSKVVSTNPLFFLRLLYNKDVKPGMSALKAKEIFMRYLTEHGALP